MRWCISLSGRGARGDRFHPYLSGPRILKSVVHSLPTYFLYIYIFFKYPNPLFNMFQHGNTGQRSLNAVCRISLRLSASPQSPRQNSSNPMTCCTASFHPAHSKASSSLHFFAASNTSALLVQARIIPQVP